MLVDIFVQLKALSTTKRLHYNVIKAGTYFEYPVEYLVNTQRSCCSSISNLYRFIAFVLCFGKRDSSVSISDTECCKYSNAIVCDFTTDILLAGILVFIENNQENN